MICQICDVSATSRMYMKINYGSSIKVHICLVKFINNYLVISCLVTYA